MEPRTLKYIAAACAGEQLTGSPEWVSTGICTDSRKVQAGDVFLALAGPRYDGHHFLSEVSEKAVAVVVERERLPVPALDCAVIAVENTRQALGRLGSRYRSDFRLPTIVVGGSNGKTTTKELIASALRQKLCTLSSEASFNNDIGVPLTLLRLNPRHQAAVLEVGTNHPGELTPLVAMAQPHYGVITNIGREHLQFFGNLAGVAAEEGWIAELLPEQGTLFLNGDSEFADLIRRRTRAKVLTVGWDARNEWHPEQFRVTEQGVEFHVSCPYPHLSGRFELKLLGRHQAINALFAHAVAAELGLDFDAIYAGLLACVPARQRLQIAERNGIRVLDDAYNANTDSVVAALQTLSDLPCSGRRVAVLGDMAELGAQRVPAHREIGHRSAELGVQYLVAVGEMAGQTAAAARASGVQAVDEFADIDSAIKALPFLVREGDVVLCKASRAARFERLVQVLLSAPHTAPAGIQPVS